MSSSPHGSRLPAPPAPSARPALSRRPVVLASAVALAVSGASAAPAARAALSAETRGAGLALLEQVAPDAAGQTRSVLLNGQRLLLRSRSTEQPVSVVLDAFESECRAPRDTGRAEAASAHPSEPWLTARHADPDGSVGQSACLARSDGRSLPARLWEFARSGDLSSLGQARYVLARRAPASAGTHVLEVWSSGTLSLRELLDGPDAPSADPVPSPAGAEPLLDAHVEGEPDAVRLFTSTERPRVLLDRYARQLLASGFEAVPGPANDGASPSRAFLNADRAALVSASRVGSQTLLSRVDIARPRLAAFSAEAR